MDKLIDMHCHIVPGVDDGAGTLDDALAILEEEAEQGVTDIIITPHFRLGMFENPRDEVEKRFRVLCGEAERLFPGLNLYLGCEFHSNSDLPAMLAAEPRYRMIGTEYVLLEFSSAHSGEYIRDRVYAAVARGFIPIVAHCERYGPFMKDLAFAREVVDLGALLQVNADTVIGKSGWGPKRFAAKLLKEGLVSYIGSDAHDTKRRASRIGKARRQVEKLVGQERARRIFMDNPMRIIEASGSRRRY